MILIGKDLGLDFTIPACYTTSVEADITSTSVKVLGTVVGTKKNHSGSVPIFPHLQSGVFYIQSHYILL